MNRTTTEERLERLEERLEAVEAVITAAQARYRAFVAGPGRKWARVLGIDLPDGPP